MRRFLIILFLFFGFAQAETIRPDAVTECLHALEADTVSGHDGAIITILKSYESHLPVLFGRYQVTQDEFKTIENKFKEAEIPLFFAVIPYAESKFNAKSRGYGTAGLWQFSKQSARNFGLNVTKKNDERLNPDRSTDAVIRYIKSLKRQFGSWYLADFAYAMGEGTLQKLIKKNQTSDIAVLLQDPHFPSGTKAHFAKTLLLHSKIHYAEPAKATDE